MPEMLKPKPVTLLDQEGVEHKFILSKIPAIQAREIMTQYPISALPRVGDYKVNEQMMFKLVAYVAVDKDVPLMLNNPVVIANHVPDWELLAKIEMAQAEYNNSFLQNGRISDYLGKFVQKTLQSISQMLMGLSEQSSPTTKQPSTNSEPSTT